MCMVDVQSANPSPRRDGLGHRLGYEVLRIQSGGDRKKPRRALGGGKRPERRRKIRKRLEPLGVLPTRKPFKIPSKPVYQILV